MKEAIRQAKLRLLKMHFESGVGHIGGNLSSIDLLMTIYHRVLTPQDSFILSKGHAAGALYVTLWSRGCLSEDDLKQFHKDHTRLPGHPPVQGIPEISFAAGSLGHGIGVAAGMALGRKLRPAEGRVLCLTSDGEWNEGSSWEALIFAAQRSLNNFTLIVDLNGLQGFGRTCEVADLDSLAEKFHRFGFNVEEINGHDVEAIERTLRAPAGSRPRAIVARTVKGHGVSFMEDRMEWHYLPMTREQYEQAVAEVAQP